MNIKQIGWHVVSDKINTNNTSANESKWDNKDNKNNKTYKIKTIGVDHKYRWFVYLKKCVDLQFINMIMVNYTSNIIIKSISLLVIIGIYWTIEHTNSSFNT